MQGRVNSYSDVKKDSRERVNDAKRNEWITISSPTISFSTTTSPVSTTDNRMCELGYVLFRYHERPYLLPSESNTTPSLYSDVDFRGVRESRKWIEECLGLNLTFTLHSPDHLLTMSVRVRLIGLLADNNGFFSTYSNSSQHDQLVVRMIGDRQRFM
jgi:hypothetical protein